MSRCGCVSLTACQCALTPGDGMFVAGSGASGDGYAPGVLLTAGSDDQAASLGSDAKLFVPGGGPRTAATLARVQQTAVIAPTATYARWRRIANHEFAVSASWTVTVAGSSGVAIAPSISFLFGDSIASYSTLGPVGTFMYWKSSATAQWFYGLVYCSFAAGGLSSLQLIAHGSTGITGLLGTAPAFAAAIGDKLDLQLRYESSYGLT